MELAESHSRWQDIARELRAGGEDPAAAHAAAEVEASGLELLRQVGTYIEEVEEHGTISDPEFERWFIQIEPIARDSLRRARRRWEQLLPLRDVNADRADEERTRQAEEGDSAQTCESCGREFADRSSYVDHLVAEHVHPRG